MAGAAVVSLAALVLGVGGSLLMVAARVSAGVCAAVLLGGTGADDSCAVLVLGFLYRFLCGGSADSDADGCE